MASESGIDLAKLEYEFATNPNSEAFIPLAEAYLGMGRFVEAMVVCKKGIKAHPDLPTGRLIMARIYSDQAKHQKALDEINKLLKLSPENHDAHRLVGNIYLKLGREEEGIKSLKKALDLKPDDREAQDSLLKIGIDYIPSKEPPQPKTPSWPSTAAAPGVAPTPHTLSGVLSSERPTERALPTVEPVRESPISEFPTYEAMPASARAQPAAAPALEPPKKRIADIYNEMEVSTTKPGRGKSFKATLYMGGGLVIALIIYVIYTWQAGLRQKEINTHLAEGRTNFKQDSYPGYKKALEEYRAVLKLEKNHEESLARSAFIAAVLAGEYGEQDTKDDKDKPIKMIDLAAQRLSMASSLKLESSMLTAAQAMMALYGGGNLSDTLKTIENAIKNNPDSAVLHTAMGQILLRRGDLNQAKDHLLRGAAQMEIRALFSLGQYAMRRSMYREAATAFNRALQNDRSHVKSLLHRALLALLWGDSSRHSNEAAGSLNSFKTELEANAAEVDKKFADFVAAILKSRSGKRSESNAGFAEMKAQLKKESGNALFHFAAAREMRRAGNHKEALDTIKLALRLDSSRPDFVLEEASVFLEMKDYEAARARALRVQEMDSESGQSLLIIGDAYLGERNFERARQYLRNAAGFDDVSGIAYLKLGDMYLSQPNPDRDLAQAQYELAIPVLGASGENRLAAETSYKLAQIFAAKNRHSEFFATLQKAIQIDASYGPPHCLLAGNLKTDTKEDQGAAVEMCETCVKLNSGDITTRCREIIKKFK